MKASSSTLVASVLVSVTCLTLTPTEVAAQSAPQAQMQTVQQKPSFWSRFRRNQTPPQAQAPAVQEKSGLRLPHFKKPDFSRIPKPRLPQIRKPNISVPKLKLPFGGQQQVSRQTVQDYPNAIRNPSLGGAYGVVTADQVKFYEVGPGQPGGADSVLSQGSSLTIRSNDRSWAYVTLKDGRSGYVGLDQVRFAGASEVPKAPAPKPVKKKRSSYVAKNDSKKKSYAPPELPAAAAELPASPETNPLLQSVASETETISSDVSPIDDPEALVETRQQPVDSPEVLFDPILDPIEPGPGTDPGGPEPFLNDPIPSIEEELRAIQQAKESALPAEDGGV